MTDDPFMTATSGAIVRTDLSAAAASRRLANAGWDVAAMPDGGETHDAVLAAIGRALRFPDHYGQNLDALWDCLSELAAPTALVWSDWQDAAVADPGDWARIMQVLRERTDDEPPFLLVLCVPDREDEAEI